MTFPTNSDVVVRISLLNPQTGKAAGVEAKVDVTDGDLCAQVPWYVDESGPYTITHFQGVAIRVQLYDLIGARHMEQAILASGMGPEHLETGGLPEERDLDFTDFKKRTTVQETVVASEAGDIHFFYTCGLAQLGHLELQLVAPGFCRDIVVEALVEGANCIIHNGDRYEDGDIIHLGGQMCLLVSAEAFDGVERLHIIEMADADKKCDDDDGEQQSIAAQTSEGASAPTNLLTI